MRLYEPENEDNQKEESFSEANKNQNVECHRISYTIIPIAS